MLWIESVALTGAQEGNHTIYKIRDPYGFCWILRSSNLTPQHVFHTNDANQVNSAHVILLIDHPRATQVSQWLQGAVGAQQIHQQWNTVSVDENIVVVRTFYLTVGLVNRRRVIEVRDAIRPRRE